MVLGGGRFRATVAPAVEEETTKRDSCICADRPAGRILVDTAVGARLRSRVWVRAWEGRNVAFQAALGISNARSCGIGAWLRDRDTARRGRRRPSRGWLKDGDRIAGARSGGPAGTLTRLDARDSRMHSAFKPPVAAARLR
jgi:hypothetical protein